MKVVHSNVLLTVAYAAYEHEKVFILLIIKCLHVRSWLNGTVICSYYEHFTDVSLNCY